MKVLSIFVLGLLVAVSANYIDKDRVHFITSVPAGSVTNHLFRGNMPKDQNNQFALDDLQGFIRTAAEVEGGVTLPDRFYLYVINLMSLYNQNDTAIEQDFFQNNQNVGKFVQWSLYHRYANPLPLTDEKRQEMLSDAFFWGKDDFPARIELLDHMLRTFVAPDGLETVFYFHCESGCDRTGEISGAYMLAFMNKTMDEVNTINTKQCGRPANPSATYCIEWFCFWRQYHFPDFRCPVSEISTTTTETQVSKNRKIIYLAAFVTPESKQQLLAEYPPIFSNVFGHHMTIAFSPSQAELDRLPWGQTISLTVTGYAADDKAQAVVVDTNGQVWSNNPITHVSISTAPGVSPVYSNDLVAHGLEAVSDGITIEARVGAYVSGGAIIYDPNDLSFILNDEDAPTPASNDIFYLAAFLTPESHQKLLSRYAPVFSEVFAQHMTIAFAPSQQDLDFLPWGKNVTLTVFGYAVDDKAQACAVSANTQVWSRNPITHVSISTAAGVNPVWSNNLLANGFKPVTDGFTLDARVGAALSDGSLIYEKPL